MDLDNTDVEIIGILQRDGRISFRDVSKKIGVATPTVSERVKRLEKLGVIKGYAAIVDPEALGELTLVLKIKTAPTKLDHVGETLKKMKEFKEIYIVSKSELFTKATISEGNMRIFLAGLEAIPEIVDYEYSIVLRALKEGQRAMVTEGLSINLECAYCDAPIKGEPVKVKLGGEIRYVCCRICARESRERYEKWAERRQNE